MFNTDLDQKVDQKNFILTNNCGKSLWIYLDGSIEWLECWVTDYDKANHEYIIKWKHNFEIKRVKRMNLLFEGEDESIFMELREQARLSRLKFYLWQSLKDFALHEVTVPPCKISFPSEQLERILLK